MPAVSKLPASPVVLLLLAACSGGDGNGSGAATPGPTPSPLPPAPPADGTLIVNPPVRVASLTPEQLLGLANVGFAGRQLLQFVADPKCTVDVHYLQYRTLDPAGALVTASGALMVPVGANPECQGPRPVLVYAHGTADQRSYNIADLGNPDSVEGLLIAITFAARGYIVVAPNYAGYDTSSLDYHPYLNAAQQSKDVADALSAARSALPTSFAPTVTDSGKLFVTGYSEGGFVAMATHRHLQEIGAPVTASAPMSGPYAMSAFGDAVFYGEVISGAPTLVAAVATGYQRAYRNVYTTPAEVFDSRYAPTIEGLLPAREPRSQLFDQGLLPREQLFSSTPPDPAYAPFTPATSPPELAHVFARGFGPEALILNSYRLAYLQDAQLHPDGGFPVVTDDLPPAAPQIGLRVDFKTNDLRNWLPASPVLLCAGQNDPTVLYLNTDLMQQFWMRNPAPGPVQVLNIDSGVSLDDPNAALKAGFAAAKEVVAAAAVASGAADGGAQAVSDAYHATLVPPFCLAATASFFEGR